MAVFDKKRLSVDKKHVVLKAADVDLSITVSSGRALVLLVDDEPQNLKALQLILSDTYDLILASNGHEAVDLLRHMRNPDCISVIISDQRMPGLSGLEVLEEAMAVSPNTARILLTAYTDIKDLIASVNYANLYRYLVKPLDEHDLLMTVRNAVETAEMRRDLHRCLNQLETIVDEKTEEMHRNIANLQENLLEVQRASMTDPLTGLLNRRGLEHQLKTNKQYSGLMSLEVAELAMTPQASTYLILLVDLDHFKWVNDTHGHGIGDRVLQHVAEIVRNCFRQDDLIVRWGGEELLIISSIYSSEDAQHVVERVRCSIELTPLIAESGREITCTASIGYALCTPPDLENVFETAYSWQDIVELADACLYAAKHSGRNAWVGVEPDAQKLSKAQDIRPDVQAWLAGGYAELRTSLAQPDDINWKSNRQMLQAV